MSLFIDSHFSVFAEDCFEEEKNSSSASDVSNSNQDKLIANKLISDQLINNQVINNQLISGNQESNQSACPAIWDDVLCWFPIPAGKIARVSCGSMFQAIGSEIPKDDLFKGKCSN